MSITEVSGARQRGPISDNNQWDVPCATEIERLLAKCQTAKTGDLRAEFFNAYKNTRYVGYSQWWHTLSILKELSCPGSPLVEDYATWLRETAAKCADHNDATRVKYEQLRESIMTARAALH